jgi:hypothetical protein
VQKMLIDEPLTSGQLAPKMSTAPPGGTPGYSAETLPCALIFRDTPSMDTAGKG